MEIDVTDVKTGHMFRYETSVVPRIGDTLANYKNGSEWLVTKVEHNLREIGEKIKLDLITVEVVQVKSK